MKTKNKILIGALALAALSFSSCKKEVIETNTQAKQQKAAELTVLAKKQILINRNIAQLTLTTFPQMIARTSKYMKTDGGIEETWECAVVTIDSSTSPRVATFDFGTGCYSTSGTLFAGKVTITYLDPDMRTAGNYIEVHFDNFTADTLTFNGMSSFRNDGNNAGGNMIGQGYGNLTTNFSSSNMSINGETYIDFEYVSARNTSLLTISGTGTNNSGLSYTQSTNATISFNLDPDCIHHFTKGKLLIQSPGLSDEEIDYGTGSCDDQATSTVDGVTTNITLN